MHLNVFCAVSNAAVAAAADDDDDDDDDDLGRSDIQPTEYICRHSKHGHNSKALGCRDWQGSQHTTGNVSSVTNTQVIITLQVMFLHLQTHR